MLIVVINMIVKKISLENCRQYLMPLTMFLGFYFFFVDEIFLIQQVQFIVHVRNV
jgi:hypothetical protein